MRALLANCEMIASGRPHQSASPVAQLPAVPDQERNQVLAQMIATVECEEAMIDVAPDRPVP